MDLNTYFIRYKTKKENKLLNAIMYQLNIMDDVDYRLYFNVQVLNAQLNEKFSVNYDINFITMIMRLFYNAGSVVSNLPHLLNKPLVNGKPSLHVVMGESMAQLVSLSLINEINQVLDYSLRKLHDDIETINDIKYLFMKLMDDIQEEDVEKHEKLLEKEYSDEEIKETYELNKNKIFKATEKLCFEYYNFIINKRNNKYIVKLAIDENENYYFEEYIKNDYLDDNTPRELNQYEIKRVKEFQEQPEENIKNKNIKI